MKESLPVDERQIKIRKVTLWGIFLNIFLMVLKIASGILIKSSALIADGVHSLSDLATDFVVLIGTRLSSRPADKTHPYGHGKMETIPCLILLSLPIMRNLPGKNLCLIGLAACANPHLFLLFHAGPGYRRLWHLYGDQPG